MRAPESVRTSIAAATTKDDLRSLLAAPDIDWTSCFDVLPVADVVRLLRAAHRPYPPAGLASLAARAVTSADVLSAVVSTSDGDSDDVVRDGFASFCSGVPEAVRAGAITPEALAVIAVAGNALPAGYDGVADLLAWVGKVRGASDRTYWRAFYIAVEPASKGLGIWWSIRGALVSALTGVDPTHALEFAEEAASWPTKEPYPSIRGMGWRLQDTRFTEALLRRIPEYREPRLVALGLAALPPNARWPEARVPALSRDDVMAHVDAVLSTPVDGEDGTREEARREWLLDSWSLVGPAAATEGLRISLRGGLPHEAVLHWRSDASLRLLALFRARRSAVEPRTQRDEPFLEAERVLRDVFATTDDAALSKFVRLLHDQLAFGIGGRHSWTDARDVLRSALGGRAERLDQEARGLLER